MVDFLANDHGVISEADDERKEGRTIEGEKVGDDEGEGE